MTVDRAQMPDVPSTSDAPGLVPGREFGVWYGDGFTLDESTLELVVGGTVTPVEPKPLEMLLWLLRHAGEVVTKEELLDALWLGRVVSESVLTSCVGKLRAALGDETHAIVKTVHGYGYRLAASVRRERKSRPVPVSRLATGDAPPHRPNWRLVRRLAASLDEAWLVEHAKSGERRVLKFAFDAVQLSRIKREITLHRLLRQALGPRDDLVAVLDWNLEQAPFFVEFEWCELGSLDDAEALVTGLPTDARVALAAAVAAAAAAAHSAGVLHKDIKPGNVLLRRGSDGSLQAKLADFGSGALVDDGRLFAMHITRLGFTQEQAAPASGTFSYLAPEVLAGQPPTVRADVFALGVLLYQLAVGDLRRSIAPGWERDVDDALLRADIGECCDVDPGRRLGDAAELARRLAHLDLRRSEDEARRRAEADAADLQAALVRGRARRRWLALVAGVATVGLVVSAAMLVQARSARADAEEQAAVARAINDYLVEDLIGAADPMAPRAGASASSVAAAGQVPVRDLLDRAASGTAARFAGQPRLEAAVRASLAQAYTGLGEFAAAERESELAARAARDPRHANPLAEAAALRNAAMAARDLDRLDAADAHLAGARTALGRTERSPEAMRLSAEIDAAAAWLLYKRGDYPRAIAGFRAALPALERAFGADSHEVAEIWIKLSGTELVAGDVAAAIESARKGLALRLRIDPPEHPRLVDARAALSDALRHAGADDEAEREARAAHAIAMKSLGADHSRTVVAQSSLASILQQRGRTEEAIRLFEDAVERTRSRFGELSYELGVHHNNLGLAYADAGRLDDATGSLRHALAIARKLLGDGHPELLKTEHNIADILADAGRWQESLAIERRLLPAARAAFGDKHFLVGVILRTTARAELHLGQAAAAAHTLAEARSILAKELGESHAKVAQVDALAGEVATALRGVPAAPPSRAPAVDHGR